MSSRRPTGGSEARRSEFKNQGLTQDEFRRRREETSVELRKAKKEDSLNKRRSILDSAATTKATEGDYASSGNDSSPEMDSKVRE
jgi:importin subunit alpha-1